MVKTAEFWFRQHYRLPPNDPRFLELTPLEILTEFYAHKYWENPKAQETVEDEDFNLEDELARIEAEEAENDAVVDQVNDWEDMS